MNKEIVVLMFQGMATVALIMAIAFAVAGVIMAGSRHLLRRHASKIVVGADYRATYKKRAIHPWDQPEVRSWKVKVVDVKDGWVRYCHYDDNGEYFLDDKANVDYQVASVDNFLSLYVLEPKL